MATRKAPPKAKGKIGRPRKARKSVLETQIAVRCTKAEKVILTRLTANVDSDPSRTLRQDIQARIALLGGTMEIEGGRILVADGRVWFSPGLGQWVPMVPSPDGRGCVVGLHEEPAIEVAKWSRTHARGGF